MRSATVALITMFVFTGLTVVLQKWYFSSSYDLSGLYKESKPTDVRKTVKENLNESDSTRQTREKQLNEIWNYVYKLQYICSDIEEVGGDPKDRDGFYPVCKEPKFWKLTSDKKSKCLVYSFGVGGDFTFDDGVAAKGCEVHAFDPSSPYKDGWVRDSGVTFHKIGVGEQDTDKGPNGWKMRTIASLKKMLGHEGRMIDILKVDIEGGEDSVMNDLIFSGMHKCVRQYDVEIHYTGPLTGVKNNYFNCRVIWEQLQYLHQHGYKIFQTTDNVRFSPKYTQQMRKKDILTKGAIILWEISFVNENALDVCHL